MKRHLLTAFAFAAFIVAILPMQAQAASQVLCAPAQAGQGSAAQRVTNPNTTTAYQLDNHGCAVIVQADVGYFVSQGYVSGPLMRSLTAVTGVLVGNTGAGIVQLPSLPASAFIREIIVQNTTANAVTGGVDIGTTSGAADVISALTCGANCLTFVADAALLKRVFSTTAQQALFVLGKTAGNSSNLTITIIYGYF